MVYILAFLSLGANSFRLQGHVQHQQDPGQSMNVKETIVLTLSSSILPGFIHSFIHVVNKQTEQVLGAELWSPQMEPNLGLTGE